MTAYPKHRRNSGRVLRPLALLLAVVAALVAGLLPSASASPTVALQPTVPFASHHTQRAYPKLPSTVAHAGSAIIAFRTPVSVSGARFGHNARGDAGATALAHLNATLAGLKVTGISHLFTNLPAATLNRDRAKAQAATGRYVTDFTQVYQLTYDPKINSGTAANRLAASSLLTSAMPDFKFSVPNDSAALSDAQVRQALAAVAKAKSAKTAVSGGLPSNAGYTQDAQSYQDAASDDVTGAAAMIAKKYGQEPGQGEVVTNVSLGTINNQSTVLENGQRYIVEAGYPKIRRTCPAPAAPAAPACARSSWTAAAPTRATGRATSPRSTWTSASCPRRPSVTRAS